MEPANGIPGKVPEHPEAREAADVAKRPEAAEPPLPELPREDALVRVLRRVPMYAFVLFLGVVAADFLFPGVKVVVHNAGPGTMRNVEISVRNDTKTLEPIPEGQEDGVRFRLLGDALIYIAYTDEAGKTAAPSTSVSITSRA